jgi:hypothetical protein
MGEKNDTDIDSFNCAECGIKFGIDKKVVINWTKSHKTFVCPNGHKLSWGEQSSDEKELIALRIEAEELKEKLATALIDIDIQKVKVTDLTNELELWRPTTKE